jgi:hypothetical protein
MLVLAVLMRGFVVAGRGFGFDDGHDFYLMS